MNLNVGESTPLAGTFSLPATGSSLLTRENAGKAASYAKSQAEQMSNAVKNGEVSIRAMALLGGVGMVTSGVLNLMGRIVTFRWVSALMNFYIIVFGLLAIVLEGRKWLPIPKSFETIVRKYALFLDFIWGRGVIYFFIGSLQLSLWNWLDIAVGGYMCFVGLAYIWVGGKAAKKMSQIRKSLFTNDELRDRFNTADVNHTGTIDLRQFRSLMTIFGVTLDNTEAESAFLRLDKSGEGVATFEEFLVWWGEAEFGADHNAQFFLSI